MPDELAARGWGNPTLEPITRAIPEIHVHPAIQVFGARFSRLLYTQAPKSIRVTPISSLVTKCSKNRAEILDLLKALPGVAVAEHDEVMHFLSEKRLYGRGLGWIDLHLLASAALSRARLWTTDRPLKRAAEQLGLHRLT